MKTTYLVYKQVDGVRQLVAATQEEWDAIMKENRGLPIGQRRCFMKDCFEDGDELDCMYIETTAAEYREWNSENTIAQRKRKVGSSYSFYLWTPGCPKPTLSHCTKASPPPLTLRVLLPTTF